MSSKEEAREPATLEAWMEGVAALGSDCLVWLLFLADNPGRVTFNKSSDFKSQRRAVERYADQLGVAPFDAYGGYKRLLRTRIEVGNLVGPAIMDDKSDDTIKFTRKVGKMVFSVLRADTAFREALINALDVGDDRGEGWFPFEMPEAAAVRMAGRNPVLQDDGRTHFNITALLDCAKCGTQVRHEYSTMWPSDQWLTIEALCDTCSYLNTHYMIGPERAPW